MSAAAGWDGALLLYVLQDGPDRDGGPTGVDRIFDRSAESGGASGAVLDEPVDGSVGGGYGSVPTVSDRRGNGADGVRVLQLSARCKRGQHDGSADVCDAVV